MALYQRACTTYNVPVFLQPWWLNIVSPGWEAAVAIKGEHICGIWPYRVEQKLGVKIIRTPLLTPYIGPCVFYPADMKLSRRDSFEHETVVTLFRQIPEAPVWQMAVQPALRQVGFFHSRQLVSVARQTFFVDLTPSEEQIRANFSESMRKNIRQAIQQIEIVDATESASTLYELHKATLVKKGKKVAHSAEMLQQLLEECTKNDAGKLWAATANGIVQAMVWQVWDASCSYYLMGAQNDLANDAKPLCALLWHSMKEAKKRGINTFDLEGSMDPGVERFFRGFGGDRQIYLTLTKDESITWKLKKQILG